MKEELTRRFDAAVAAGFSGSALVVVGGRPVLANGYGLADRPRQVPNTADTAFDFGSVMKGFTSAAIFELAAQGKLAVAASIATVLEAVPADKRAITILQLIQHRAGLGEYHDTEGDFEPMTRLEARARIFAQPLLFEPGTDQAYSNSGYTLLADIVEIVSGQPFTEYVRTHLFVPAKMNDSGFFGDSVWQRVETAIGYDASTFGTNDPAEWPYTWSLVGNGGLVTTVSDLDRWLTSLWTGRVVAPGFDAYRTQYLAGGAHDIDGKTVYVSAGAGDYGLGGFVMDCPAENTRVIIGTNTYDTFDIEAFGIAIGKLALTGE